MLRESQLLSIGFWLGQGEEVLIVCADEENKKRIQEQTKFFSGNLKIKTIDHKNTFKEKVNPIVWIEETAPTPQEI